MVDIRLGLSKALLLAAALPWLTVGQAASPPTSSTLTSSLTKVPPCAVSIAGWYLKRDGLASNC
ncbi:hypothetical protein TOPH_07650 [Tolypocladium ophioglossoides CBS 100239]|uniref:Uncharacterized protein n=1 Tax=Tolypocladium ophioglossoides (strain CBS 100239) TaxID=1163406 RepID=A0A0L0N0Q6_TOLOC|nr:hypothetical protein TOPH_07650 [Tolypocladium ophioglossoides CBS 100239]